MSRVGSCYYTTPVIRAGSAVGDGRVGQRSALTGNQKTILAALDLPEPPKYLDFTPGIDAAVAD